ncbi:hypothetical protein [Actinomadura sp. K4S16]|uniref:hypothetical protein n=1 Tax=Actinomadura sp. K4S16 TaxID=1316147 RepID=UPI0011EE3FCE|nr:hypothetical protein [Actinomadura sp. K4S16]
MTVLKPAGGGAWWTTMVGGGMAGLISWRAAGMVLVVLAVSGITRIFIEWQRRRTFTALAADAPHGTVIVQQDGPDGQMMRVTLGGRSRLRPSEDSG